MKATTKPEIDLPFIRLFCKAFR
jgi:hypothetical protein